jgi:hypothetical protein
MDRDLRGRDAFPTRSTLRPAHSRPAHKDAVTDCATSALATRQGCLQRESLVEDLGENLFAHKLGSELGRLADMLCDALQGLPMSAWQTRYNSFDEGVILLIQEVLATAERLNGLAAELNV